MSRLGVALVGIVVFVAVLYGLELQKDPIADASQPVEVLAPSPFREGFTPDWALNGQPMPPSETVPPPQPGDIYTDEITPIDEALAAEALNPPTAEEREREWATKLAVDLGVSPEAALRGLILLRTIDTRDFHDSVEEWLEESYAGGWIDWEADTPYFHYAYRGELPSSKVPDLLGELIASGDAILVRVP